MSHKELRNSGVTNNTPKNIMFGAGTFHKNLQHGYFLLSAAPSDWATGDYYTRTGSVGSYEYTAVATESRPAWAADTYYYLGWNFDESLWGATQGGSKVSIKPEIKDIEADGALVKVKDLAKKVGETATMEVNLLEITPEHLKAALLADSSSGSANSGIDGYDEIKSKIDINQGDYVTNLGFIGKTVDGSPIIVIFDNALCTSGLDLESKNKENGVLKMTFECYADANGNLQVLPYHIYTPTPVL